MAVYSEYFARCSGLTAILGKTGLGKTGEDSVRDFMTAQRFGYEKDFSNKYTKKGIRAEDEAIALVAERYDLGLLFKNEETKFSPNGKIRGTCDIRRKKQIRDIKCSWSVWTFPWLELEANNPTYVAQGNGYMECWDIDDYVLDYVLIDATEAEITSEYWRKHYSAGIEGDEVDADLYEKTRAQMIFSHLPIEDRIKSFKVDRDENLITKIYNRVDMAREFQQELILTLNKNK